MAAVLWAGPDAVASHDTAAALWGITRWHPPVHVTVPRKPGSAPTGVRTHVGAISKRDRGALRGVPVTNAARTLLDLAGGLPEDRLLPLVEKAVLEGVASAERVRDVLERNRGRRGCRRLGIVLDAAASSALERRVDAILRDAGLPPCEREFPVGRFRIDFAWPAAKVAIEADGRRWHSSTEGFARDRAKHNLLVAEGWRILRVTWSDLDRPEDVAAAARSLLAPRPYPGTRGQGPPHRSQAGGTQWQSPST